MVANHGVVEVNEKEKIIQERIDSLFKRDVLCCDDSFCTASNESISTIFPC